MTIRDLLRNTSGLVYASPDYADPGFGNAAIHVLYGAKAPFRRDKPIASFVASLGTLPLLHQPGEVWEYSIGYDVLGRVIEVVSGQTFRPVSAKPPVRAAAYGRQRLLGAGG